jgi:predicted metalloprotease
MSGDIDDRRGEGGDGGPRLPLGGGGFRLGLGGILLLLVLSFVLKRDLISPFLGLSGGLDPSPAAARPNPARDRAEQPLAEFVSFVLDDLQLKTWPGLLQGAAPYRRARLVLFRDQIDSACGFAQSASGPFYCPGDEKVYVDLGFFEELRAKFGAPGDFAQAYVISHEIGHHVQNVLGIEARIRAAQRRDRASANALSVRMELQADCLAGLWGAAAARRNILEAGDVEEGLAAAAAIGDDRLQRMSTGRVMPEKFTHGTSRQRVEAFRRGMEASSVNACLGE